MTHSPVDATETAVHSLLRRWPITCRIGPETAIGETARALGQPCVLVMTGGPAWTQFRGSGWRRVDTGDVIVAHDPSVVVVTSSLPPHYVPGPADLWGGRDPLKPVSAIVLPLDAAEIPISPSLLPAPFLIERNVVAARALSERLAATVIEAAKIGFGAAVDFTAHAFYLDTLAHHLVARTSETRVFSGLFDAEIGPVIQAMLESPAKDWTVESLAEVGGMSRSAFARKFRELMEVAPIDFLVEMRMWQASRQLRQPSHDLRRIALEAGYQSPAAFSVAFKRWSGATPSDYRRRP
jgi:AraC-like DNA-binding protein